MQQQSVEQRRQLTNGAVGQRRYRWRALKGYLFISPWLLGFSLLVAGPLVYTVYLGFTRYSLLSAPRWVGLENYRYALTDPQFSIAVKNTLFYVAIAVPVGLSLSLFLAILLDQGIRGHRVLRMIFFLPSITPIVASVLIWRWLLQPEFGLVNYLLISAGVDGPGWLASTTWVKPSLITITVWMTAGGSRMLVFLAGLQAIPNEQYEAAQVDGATFLQKFRHVSLPLLTPAIFFNLIIAVVDGFRVFTLAYAATEGGPGDASLLYSLYIFFAAFKFSSVGYGAMLATILFVVILALTMLNFALSRRWVHYERG